MDVLFVEKWKDIRLKHSYTNFLMFSDKSQMDRLWTPDIYFANSKTAMLNFVMVPNMNVRIWNDGRVRMVTRYVYSFGQLPAILFQASFYLGFP